jgi:hypothetical protein
MERHFANGAATTVALMSAHRAASGPQDVPIIFCQEAVAEIEAYLETCQSTRLRPAERNAVGFRPCHAFEETCETVAEP